MTDEEIQALHDELESTKAELESMKSELEARNTQIKQMEQVEVDRSARITGFETIVTEKDAEVSGLKLAIDESTVIASEAKQSLANAVSAYRTIVVKANPHFPEELITGDTIDEINQSVEQAHSLITKVRESIEAEVASGKVPAGAPARTPPDLEGLSPREKIQYAITKGGKRKWQ